MSSVTRMSTATSSARAVRLEGLAALNATVALLAVAANLGWLPDALGVPCALWTLFFGLGVPLVSRASPVDSAWLKLALFGSLASPVVATAVYLLARTALDAPAAVAATLALALPLQALLLRQRTSVAPQGCGGWGAVAIALGCALLVAAFVLRGSAPRVSYHGLLHSSVAFAVDRSMPPENPWLAETQLAYYWTYHATGALVARAAGIAPTIAFAWINVWSAFTLPLSLYFAVAQLVSDAKRALAGVLLAVFGLNALGGWLWLARGTELGSPGSPGELLAALSALVPGVGAEVDHWGARLAFGFAKNGNVSSHPLALALAAGGLAAAAHALRNGARVWVGLTGVLFGAAFAWNPILGGAALGSTLLAAFLFARSARIGWTTIAALVAGALPGVALVATAGGQYGGSLVEAGLHFDHLLPGWLPLLLLALPAGFALRRFRSEREIAGLLFTLALLPALVFALVELPVHNEYKLVRLAALPLGLLAGVGLFDAGRAYGATLMLLLVPGVLANNALGIACYLAFGGAERPLAEGDMSLLPTASDDNAEGTAWARIYAHLATREDLAGGVLVLRPRSEGPVYGAPADDTLFRYTDRANLQGHEAAAFSGMSLCCDQSSYMVENHPAYPGRVRSVAELYVDERNAATGPLPELLRTGRPVVVVVTERDRMEFEGTDLDRKLRQLGLAITHREGRLMLYSRAPSGSDGGR